MNQDCLFKMEYCQYLVYVPENDQLYESWLIVLSKDYRANIVGKGKIAQMVLGTYH